jgi:hypothetical protein
LIILNSKKKKKEKNPLSTTCFVALLVSEQKFQMIIMATGHARSTAVFRRFVWWQTET